MKNVEQFIENRHEICGQVQGLPVPFGKIDGEAYFWMHPPGCDSHRGFYPDYSDARNWAPLRQEAIDAGGEDDDSSYADVLADVVSGNFEDSPPPPPGPKELRRLVANATSDQICYAAVTVLKPELLE